MIEGISLTNDEVNLGWIDYKTQVIMPDSLKLIIPEGVWCFTISTNNIYVKDIKHDKWFVYQAKKEEPKQEEPVQQKSWLKGGFFKRF